MKQCPTCGATYADALQFCTSDGTPLAPIHGTAPVHGPASPAPRASNGLGTVAWISVALAGIAVALAVGVWLGAARVAPEDRPEIGKPLVIADADETPPPDPGRTDPPERRSGPAPVEDPGSVEDDSEAVEEPVAEPARGLYDRVVVAPNDGFLAIRERPTTRSPEVGRALHNRRITVLRADGPTQTIGGTRGQWVYIRYDGLEGYAFDGFTRSP